jgi:uncharacterized lipoprotein YajG
MTRLVLLLGLLLCSGCALITSGVDIPYQAVSAAGPDPAAYGAVADVTTVDSRATYRDRISTKKNGYGIEMAAITASNDIPSTVTNAFKYELNERGFRIGTTGATVHVDLVRFYNDFKNGFFSGDAVANVAFTVKVSAPNGSSTFSKYYEGTGTEPNIQVAGADNARAALVKAFANSVNSAVSDPDFIRAVLAAGAQPPRVASATPGS